MIHMFPDATAAYNNLDIVKSKNHRSTTAQFNPVHSSVRPVSEYVKHKRESMFSEKQ